MSDFVDFLHVVGYPLKLSKFAILDWCLYLNRFSADVLNLEILKTIWGIKLIFCFRWSHKNVMLFWVILQNTLGQSICRIFYFWLVWLVNLNTGGPFLNCTCFLVKLKTLSTKIKVNYNFCESLILNGSVFQVGRLHF